MSYKGFVSHAVVGNSTPEEAIGTAGLKRKRKPSAKVMELQADKSSRKTIPKKVKSSGKSSKSKTKNGDDNDTNGFVLDEDDDITDECL